MPRTTLSRQISLLFLSVIMSTYLWSQQEPFSMRIVTNKLASPWEITYGPDNMIWVTERTGGKITRVNPANGAKTQLLTLGNKMVQSAGQDGLMGLAIHPQFLTGKPFIYIAYTYSSADATHRLTKIERYTYAVVRNKPVLNSPVTVIANLPGSNDHNSGRLAIGPDNKLYYSIGDMGAGQFDNTTRPNNAQNLAIYEGKILRLNLETISGSWIPADNPFVDNAGNRTAVYTLGHRNPQGLVWAVINNTNLLYSCEHGPFSDDEINLLEAGRNYGWPRVGGFCDGNYNDRILGGQAVGSEQVNCSTLNVREPLASLYPVPVPPNETTDFTTWPSVAPSGMDIYNKTAIPGWQNSLLVAALKAGVMIRYKLSADGLSIVSDTIMYFRGKGRFRDICISPDGKKIYLATDNSGSTSGPTGNVTSTPPNPGAILEFTYTGPIGPGRMITSVIEEPFANLATAYPNPANDKLILNVNDNSVKAYKLYSITGVVVNEDKVETGQTKYINTYKLNPGIYVLKIYDGKNAVVGIKKIIIIH